jgi:hypothetical protein
VAAAPLLHGAELGGVSLRWRRPAHLRRSLELDDANMVPKRIA